MNLKKQTSVIALAVITALTVTVFIVSGQNTQAKQSSAWSNTRERTVAGVWQTVVTPRNCQTGAPVATSFCKVCSLLTKAAPCRNMVSVPVRVRLSVVPGTEFGSVNKAGKITRSLSPTTAIARAAFLSARRKYGPLGTRSKRRRVYNELRDRSFRCQRQPNRHRLRHRRRDAV